MLDQDSSPVVPMSAEALALVAKKQQPPTQIYDPKLRTPSPFKAPDIEMCPGCGQLMPQKVKHINNTMNDYINELGTRITMMDTRDTFDIKGVMFYRVTSRTPEGVPVSAFIKPKAPTSYTPPAPDNTKTTAQQSVEDLQKQLEELKAKQAPVQPVVTVTPVTELSLAEKVALAAQQHAAS